MEFLKRALESIPEAARSPLALIAYILTIAAWIWIASRTKRLKLVLENIHHIREDERVRLIQLEMGEVVPSRLSADQWIRFRKHRLLLYAFLAFCFLILSLFGISVWKSLSKTAEATLSVDDFVQVIPDAKIGDSSSQSRSQKDLLPDLRAHSEEQQGSLGAQKELNLPEDQQGSQGIGTSVASGGEKHPAQPEPRKPVPGERNNADLAKAEGVLSASKQSRPGLLTNNVHPQRNLDAPSHDEKARSSIEVQDAKADSEGPTLPQETNPATISPDKFLRLRQGWAYRSDGIFEFDVVLRNPSDKPVTVTSVDVTFDPPPPGTGCLSGLELISAVYVTRVRRSGATTSGPLGNFPAMAVYPCYETYIGFYVFVPVGQQLEPRAVDRFRLIILFENTFELRGPMETAYITVNWNNAFSSTSKTIQLLK